MNIYYHEVVGFWSSDILFSQNFWHNCHDYQNVKCDYVIQPTHLEWKERKKLVFSRFENIKSLICLFVYHETTPSFLGMDTKHNRWFTKTPSCLLQLLLKNCREGGKNYHDTLKSKRNTKPGTCRKNDILKKINACAQVALKQLQDISLQQKWGKDRVKQTTSKKDSFMVNSAYLIFSTPQRHIQLIVHSISIVLPN